MWFFQSTSLLILKLPIHKSFNSKFNQVYSTDNCFPPLSISASNFSWRNEWPHPLAKQRRSPTILLEQLQSKDRQRSVQCYQCSQYGSAQTKPRLFPWVQEAFLQTHYQVSPIFILRYHIPERKDLYHCKWKVKSQKFSSF